MSFPPLYLINDPPLTQSMLLLTQTQHWKPRDTPVTRGEGRRRMEWFPRSRQPILRTLGYIQGRDRNRGEGPFSTGPFNFLSSRPFPTQGAFFYQSQERCVLILERLSRRLGVVHAEMGERKKWGIAGRQIRKGDLLRPFYSNAPFELL